MNRSALARPEILFLLLGPVFGILFLFITPPWNVPDEEKHFYRAFQVSEGRLIEEMPQPGKVGGYLPKSLQALIESRQLVEVSEDLETKVDRTAFRVLFRQPLAPGDRAFLEFPNPAMYSPVAYIPPALGIAVPRMLSTPPIVLVYAGRLSALTIYLLVVFLAIRIAPIAKWGFFLLGLLPLSLFQAASLSADSFTLAISFLMTAVIFDLAFGPNSRATAAQVARLLLVAALLALSKQAYALIAFAYLLIPASRIGSRRRYWGILLLLGTIVFGLIGLWCCLIKGLYVFPTPSTSVEGQVRFILAHPVQYAAVLLRTTKYVELMSGFLGNLGWRPLHLPEMLVWPNLILLLFAFHNDGRDDITPTLWQRIVPLSIVLVTAIGICTIAYIDWTPVGHPIVRAVQGRYFLPLFALTGLSIYRIPLRRRIVFPLGASLLLLWSLFLVLRRFWA